MGVRSLSLHEQLGAAIRLPGSRLHVDTQVCTSGVVDPQERVKLFVCGARFIGICRSGRERLRPFG